MGCSLSTRCRRHQQRPELNNPNNQTLDALASGLPPSHHDEVNLREQGNVEESSPGDQPEDVSSALASPMQVNRNEDMAIMGMDFLTDIWGYPGQEPHRCGKTIVGHAILPRCEVYKRDYESVAKQGTKYLDWWEGRESSVDSTTTADPYIAISYVWDGNPSFVNWHGREVTTQALQIVEQLSKYTPHSLWVDAICIPQNNVPVKQVELKKMADIYRGALAVLCLVPEMDRMICTIVEHAAALMDMEGFRALEEGGDTHGMYLFASQGSNEALRKLFASRWWTRAWTFQEAILNNATFVVGKNMETIPIYDILKICGPIGRRAATQEKEVLGQSSSFWDSISSMKTTMSNIWRRQCTVPHDMAYSLLGVCCLQEIEPNYSLSFEEVFTNLVDKASSKGDFSWLRWAHLVDRSDPSGQMQMSVVPIPETIRAAPASAITVWHSVKIPKVLSPVRGGEFGVCIPHRSTGVVRCQSNPEGIRGTIKILQNMSYSPEEIWNLLFGMHVGLASDIDQAAGGSGLAQPLLTLTSGYIDGTLDASSITNDMVGEKPYTKGYGFTSYALMATKVWKDARLCVMQSQGGTTVVPVGIGLGQARIHKLPLESHSTRNTHLCLVVHDNARYKVSAVGVMIEKEHTGSGAWQLTRFS
ncbi:heterokaryon incompatibility protein-domain-containing protein [Boletus edulis]|nr:heterokaryon incompatibility protein-domain-containing protein [Boletus edulis]